MLKRLLTGERPDGPIEPPWADRSTRRGPGGLPEPRVPRARVSLCPWAEASMRSERYRPGGVSPADVGIARICEVAGAALRARRLREADREALACAGPAA